MADLRVGVTGEDRASDVIAIAKESVKQLGEEAKKLYELDKAQYEARKEDALRFYNADREHYFALKEDKERAAKQLADIEKNLMKEQADAQRQMEEAMKQTASEQANHQAMLIEKWNLIVEAIKVGIEKVYEFGKESIDAFSKQEQATRQLKLAVGEFSGALTEQAEVFEKTLGVSSEMVQKMDAMLYRFGVAPADIEKTTQALLDYSAATGTDALSATNALLVSAESGRTAFKELGLQYDKTGTDAEKVGKIVDALAGKVGGAAGADANTLAGRTRILTAHWEDLQKAFGGFVADVEAKLGVLSTLTASLQNAGNAWQIVRGFVQHGDMPGETMERINAGAMLDQGNAAAEAFRLSQAHGNPNAGPTHAAAVAAAKGGGSSSSPRVAAAKTEADQMYEIMQKTAEDDTALSEKNWMAQVNAQQKALQKQKDAEEHHAQWKTMMLAVYAEKGTQIAEKAAAQQAAAFEQAATSAASRVSSVLIKTMGKFLRGEKVEAGDVLGSILGAAGSVAGQFFGGSIGSEIGGQLGSEIGSSLGGGFGGSSTARVMHAGGWVGAPRYHTGTWVGADEHPAILQSGERVLSRREVQSMGGPSGVDGASRGGNVTVNVQTVDGSSSKEFFERGGGRALLNAVRTGRGNAALLFGGT